MKAAMISRDKIIRMAEIITAALIFCPDLFVSGLFIMRFVITFIQDYSRKADAEKGVLRLRSHG